MARHPRRPPLPPKPNAARMLLELFCAGAAYNVSRKLIATGQPPSETIQDHLEQTAGAGFTLIQLCTKCGARSRSEYAPPLELDAIDAELRAPCSKCGADASKLFPVGRFTKP